MSLKIGDLLYTNRFGQVVFNCPSCGAECSFDSPNTMHVWSCSICPLTIHYYGSNFLEVLSDYKTKSLRRTNELF